MIVFNRNLLFQGSFSGSMLVFGGVSCPCCSQADPCKILWDPFRALRYCPGVGIHLKKMRETNFPLPVAKAEKISDLRGLKYHRNGEIRGGFCVSWVCAFLS